MNAKMKNNLAKEALEYAIQENDRRGYVPGHDGAVKDAYIAGFEARDRIAQEREGKLVEALEYYKTGKVLFIDGTVNTTVAEKALADYKAEEEE